MAGDDKIAFNSSLTKPLFAAGLFPAGKLTQNEEIHIHSQSKDSKDDNDLATLKLELHQSTFDAIIAAQKPQLNVTLPKSPEHAYSDDSASYNEILESEEVSHKRKLSTHTDDEFMQDTSPKPRKKSKDKHHKKKKHKHKKKVKSESLDSGQSSNSNQPKIPKHVVFLNDIKNLKPEHAFHIDKKSNKDLWHYKSISKQHIATYKSFSYNCLGAPHISVKDKPTESKHKSRAVLSRYFKKEGRKQIHRKGLNCTFSEKVVAKFPCLEFISFSKEDSKGNNEIISTGNYSCLDDATALFIQGKGADYNKKPEISNDNFMMDDIFEKVRWFNERTRDEPQNVQLWLDFVEFQDVVAQVDKSFKGQTIRLREVYQPTKSVIEKKLAILDKAIEVNSSSLELKMAQLELYQDVWETDKLEKAWRDLLFTHSANVDLWQHYLTKQHSHLSKFSFSRVVKCYHHCFKTIVPILDGQVKVLNKKEDMEEKVLDLFAQYCNFLHQSGYTERAVSSYQAMIEFNLLCPASLNISTSRERLNHFEEFWDSSVPRFGEPKAKGWTKWFESRHSIMDTSLISANTEEQEDAIVLENLTRSNTWLKMETVRQNVHWIPWRPDLSNGETLESCEDLDRVVLFEDISRSVFRLSKSESCIKLVCMFLKFLGLSSEILERKLEEVSWKVSNNAHFNQFSSVSVAQFPFISSLKCGLDVDSTWKPHECLVTFISEVLIQAETYFSLLSRVTFTLLRLELEVLKLGVRRVSELSKSDAKNVKRFGKGLLKESQNRNNLIVWDSYIRVLWACSDKMEETMTMLNTALAMFMGTVTISDGDKALGLCLLCKTYCQIVLNFEPLEHIKAIGRHSVPGTEDKLQAIACLSALIENKGFKSCSTFETSPAYVLKIRKRFQTTISEMYEKLEQSSEHSRSCLIVALTECFALFEFCASGFKAARYIYESAREHVKRLSQTISGRNNILDILLKYLYQSHLSFSVNVLHVSLISLSEIRQVLTEALHEFPECPMFHSLFLETESGSHIAGRLKKFYEKGLRKPVSVIVPLFAIMSELTRHYSIIRGLEMADFQMTDSGVVHRVRSTFEHSLQSPISSHCPLLWRLYLTFEAKYGSQSRAKGIFYRALQSCPWAKCIYMDGIAIFGDDELQEVMDLMIEKETRIRMPLEEIDLLLTAEKKELQDENDKFESDSGDDVADLNVDNNVEENKFTADANLSNT